MELDFHTCQNNVFLVFLVWDCVLFYINIVYVVCVVCTLQCILLLF